MAADAGMVGRAFERAELAAALDDARAGCGRSVLVVGEAGMGKQQGKLLLTTRGRAMRCDPVALWWLLAGKTPPRSTDACQTQAGLILLIATAAQVTGDPNAIVADLLGAIGWTSGEGTSLTSSMACHAAWNTATVLRRVGAFTDERHFDRRARPTLDGVSFARAALDAGCRSRRG